MVPYHAQCPVYPPSGHEEEPCQADGRHCVRAGWRSSDPSFTGPAHRHVTWLYRLATYNRNMRNIQAQPYEGIPELSHMQSKTA